MELKITKQQYSVLMDSLKMVSDAKEQLAIAHKIASTAEVMMWSLIESNFPTGIKVMFPCRNNLRDADPITREGIYWGVREYGGLPLAYISYTTQTGDEAHEYVTVAEFINYNYSADLRG